MPTLISVHTSQGEEGRCDAKCYNATRAGCRCVCGGRNHGAGLQQAMDNTARLAAQMAEEFAATRGLAHYEARVAEDVWQLPLFT